MTVSFVTCGDNLDEEKETNFSSMPEDPKGKVLIQSVFRLLLLLLFFFFKPLR